MAFARLIFTTMLISSMTAYAQDNSSKTTLETNQDNVNTAQSANITNPTAISTISLEGADAATKNKKFAGAIALTTTTDTKSTNDETKNYDGLLTLGLSYKIDETYKAGISSSILKNLSDSFEESISDTSLVFSRSALKLLYEVTYAPKLILTIPTSRVSRDRDEMNGALSLGNAFTKEITKKLSMSITATGTAYSHKYKTNRVDRVNQQYSASEGLSFGYQQSDKFSLAAGLSFAQAWSYRGTKRDDQFGTTFSASYQMDKVSSISAGISTGGQIYRNQKGPDSAIEVYDPNSSSLFLTYGMSL